MVLVLWEMVLASLMRNGFMFSYSSDDEILKQLFVHMVRQRQCVFACAIVVFNLFHMFNANEFEKGVS
jgi:predicted small metal-binding protein